MGIQRAQLQKIVIQTRQFLNLVDQFLDERNESLKIRAVADSLFINYAIGQVVQRNVQQSAENLVNDAKDLSVSSVESYFPNIKSRLIDKPYWNIQKWLNGGMDAAWQNHARNLAQDIRQTLLCAQEWLELESYNIHMVAEGLPIPTHIQFDQALQPIQKSLADILESTDYQSLIDTLTPTSQTQSWLSHEMRSGMAFLRLRVDWRLLQNRRDAMLERQELKGDERFPDMDVKALGEQDLSLLANMLEAPVLEETSTTCNLFKKNEAIKPYLPHKKMKAALDKFLDAQTEAQKSGNVLAAEEIQDMASMEDMPRPNGFGLGK